MNYKNVFLIDENITSKIKTHNKVINQLKMKKWLINTQGQESFEKTACQLSKI